jgi:hypothetical protein
MVRPCSRPTSKLRWQGEHAMSEKLNTVITVIGIERMILECRDGSFPVADVALAIAVGEPCCDLSQITPRDWLTAQRTERLRNGCPAIHHYEFHLPPPHQGHDTVGCRVSEHGGGFCHLDCPNFALPSKAQAQSTQASAGPRASRTCCGGGQQSELATNNRDRRVLRHSILLIASRG